MKKFTLSLLILFSLNGYSQLLSWTPSFATEVTSSFVITVDGARGNKGLNGYNPTDVYVHIGVITSLSTGPSDWKYVKTTWGSTDPTYRAQPLGSNKWSFTISGGLRSWFGIINPAETIQKIAILFRSGSGSLKQTNSDGSDMYIPIYTSTVAVRITDPFFESNYKPVPEPISKNVGDAISVTAASNNAATLTLYLNGVVTKTVSAATSITDAPVLINSGNQQIVAEANDGTNVSRDTLNFFVNGGVNVAPLPAGVRDGINYINSTTATLVLYAPNKGRIGVIGDLPGSNWIEQSGYQMNKTPDGNYWWITLTGLTPGFEYSFQYLVNGTLKIADPYAEKILDPYNDQYISAATYPGLKTFPVGTSGVVSELQTAAVPYNWKVPNFSRPDKRNLIIYELLVRDFVANHNWNTLRDTLNYLKNLGINAIEIMPFNEFEGNLSWGYNPDFYFAPDKYYGPANTLKEFIDSCHKNGIAVIMDIALNHSFGMSPLVQLYWDAANNRPAPDNPWFNPVAKHAYNVGYDMNHESLQTRYYVSRILDHWLTNYKIDGFRFDLSKGFTQTQTCDNNGANCNVSAWGNYDQSRVDIWKRYYDTLQLKSPSSYCILEHFADNSEETVLANYGMQPWGNMNYNYNQASMGYNSGSDFSYGLASQRGWNNPYLVTYMESHDEERLMYKNINFGNSVPGYNIKDTATALKRQELVTAFFLTQPGPKMLWQFGELGYDYSLNYCSNGTISDACRTDSKPIRWDYFQQPNRKKLYNVYSALNGLRKGDQFKDEFTSNSSYQSLGGNFKYIILSSTANKLVVMGNFDVAAQSGSVTFPVAGTWYDYLNGGTITATGTSQFFNLQPGEYHVYTNVQVVLPVTLINFSGVKIGNINSLTWTVATEKNLNYYEVERSDDGVSFTSIGKVTAQNKTTYSFNDENANTSLAVQYYRLKMTDKDGQFSFSNIINIRREPSNWAISVTPNPYFGDLKVTINSPVQNTGTLIITDMAGKRLVKHELTISAGKNIINVNEGASLAKGTYILTLMSGGQSQSIKILKAQ
ncbi:MAG: T9SS type A sorting domain-containing protein [Bacteroidetes bacterium]|nr:T9SS type A sorting domain-containing protein [Bacteroidota bacterium]